MEAKTPNTLLAAAELAKPHRQWHELKTETDIILSPPDENGEPDTFCLKVIDDAWLLEEALQCIGWEFSKDYMTGKFKAKKSWFDGHQFRSITLMDESRTDLLLTCVETLEAMK